MKSERIASISSSFSELQHQHQLLLSAVAGTPFDPSLTDEESVEATKRGFERNTSSPGLVDVCTQTTNTAFALCAQCNDTQSVLVDSAHLVSRFCKKSALNSNFDAYDWNGLLKVGGLNAANWYQALQSDMAALDGKNSLLLKNIEELAVEKSELEENVTTLKSQIEALSTRLNSVKVR